MDPITCCLLGICCPPESRQLEITAHFEAMGMSRDVAARAAADMIRRFDSVFGGMVAQIASAAKSHAK